MGRYRNVRKRSTKNKSYSKITRTRCRPTDLDQIQDNLKSEEEKEENGVGGQYELNEDLPGNGQFPCIACGRYFIDQPALDTHLLTRVHIRRVKMTKQKQYSHDEAEFGAGKSKEVLPTAEETRAAALARSESRMKN